MEYMAAIFRKLADSDEEAMQLALEFYGPMYLLYSVYDGAEEKELFSSLLATHMEYYVLHCYWDDPAFVPELDFVMELIGQVIYVRSEIDCDDGRKVPVTTYALFRDGLFLTQSIQSDTKFLALAGLQ